MTVLGIPTHLAPRGNAWSLVRAFHAAGFVCVVMAVVIVVVTRATVPSEPVWGALVGLVPMAVAGLVHTRRGTWRSAAVFLLAGSVSTWWFTVVVLHRLHAPADVASTLVSLVTIPLVLVGGSGPAPWRVVAWSLAGFACGRVATSLATLGTSRGVAAGVLADVAIVVVVVVVGIGGHVTARLQRVQPELLRSAREEHVAAARRAIEAEAAAILHDTVLNHLSAVALAPNGALDDTVARTLSGDLTMLQQQEWLVPRTAQATHTAAGRTLDGIDRIAYEFGSDGLDVTVSGPTEAVATLPQETAVAVYRAVIQCLTNVREHAGTDRAEVSVLVSASTCTIMVVDDGRGFDEASVPADRMGIRNSIRERLARIGGDVKIWSAPGDGTSIVLTVPVGQTPSTPATDAPARGSVADAAPALPGDAPAVPATPAVRPSVGSRLGPA